MRINVHGKALWCVVSFLIALAVSGCDGSSSDAGSRSAATARVDACKILAAVGPETILDGPTDSGTLLAESHTERASVSQCQFAATGPDRTVGLLIQRVRGDSAPASRQAFLDDIRESDDLGTGEETAAALEAGREIAGLGDMALTYDLFTFNLMVWSGEVQFTVMLDGYGSDADAESRVISIAKSVLAEL